jgi:hypothetical protein
MKTTKRKGPKTLRFDLMMLIRDCGGGTVVSYRTGIHRTHLYRMAASGNITMRLLAKIKASFPVNLDKYFVEVDDDCDQCAGSVPE